MAFAHRKRQATTEGKNITTWYILTEPFGSSPSQSSIICLFLQAPCGSAVTRTGGGKTSRRDYFAMGYFAAGLFRMQS